MWTRNVAGLFGLACLLMPTPLPGQTAANPDEIPIERCDRLPVVKVRIGSAEMRFLIDTAATTVLNLKSFTAGRVKEIEVTSWSGTAATSAREVSLPELSLGSHRLRDLKLPAIDLSPIGNACGATIDGILGVDLLDIRRGLAALDRAEKLGGARGPYALQAVIAACHARARTPTETDWRRIAELYEALAQLTPSPIVELNRAVALAMASGPAAGLELIDALASEPSLKAYHLLPSVRGDFLFKLGRFGEAQAEFERAASLTRNSRERELLLDRAQACSAAQPQTRLQ